MSDCAENVFCHGGNFHKFFLPYGDKKRQTKFNYFKFFSLAIQNLFANVRSYDRKNFLDDHAIPRVCL